MSTEQSRYTDSAPPFERRLSIRQRPNDLAYLDIGTDNGGIVLDVSDEGMGLQAAVPIGSEKEIHLRIQLPNSSARIETAAKIIWLSPGNRQAGVHFENMSTEARIQILEWIRSQIVPQDTPGNSTSKTTRASDSSQNPKLSRPNRKRKWLTLMPEFDEPEPNAENPPSIVEPVAGGGRTAPIEQEPPPSIAAHDEVLKISDQPESPSPASHSEELPLDEGEAELETLLQLWDQETARHDKPNGSKEARSAVARSTYDEHGRSEFLEWPIRAPQISPAPTHDASREKPVLDIEPPRPPASIAEFEPKATVPQATPNSPPSKPQNGIAIRKWAVAAILLISTTVLGFSFGKWAGRRAIPSRSAQPLPAQAVIPASKSVESATAKQSGGAPPILSRHKTLSDSTRTNSVPESASIGPAVESSSPVAEPPAEPTPTKESTSPLPVIVRTETKPIPPPTEPPAFSKPDQSSPVLRIVAGRKLKPSDRFNACHLSYRLEPVYPQEAQQQGVEGTVKIHQVIGADGAVESVKLLSGPPLLAPAALEATKYWLYLPALLNGQRVECEQDVQIDFRLPR